ncbi:MAG: hypothetical protein Q9162_005697 [Coniocarpon cinnabarinum]
MALNYFTCTLGQAALSTTPRGGWKTVTDLVEWLGQHHPHSPAIGFAYPDADATATDKRSVLYTFSDVLKGSQHVAQRLRDSRVANALTKGSTVTLLSSSSPEFLFTWLALIRLGHAVLLVAPQNQPEAILHLCKASQATVLIYDELYKDLSSGTLEVGLSSGYKALESLSIPFSVSDEIFKHALQSDEFLSAVVPSHSPSDIAYLFHTSGTSSGLPRPIPQTHHGAIEVLPAFKDGYMAATYSTTPLYHGGISDLFRAWSSRALIWLFPGKSIGAKNKSIPITASNILSGFETIETEHAQAPPVNYFTSVPYILQMMASDVKGLRRLQRMDCVGVGGAALPAEVGDLLVEQDVNLVSRYGSAECGFLLSSHRDYNMDKAWQFLRADTGVENLAFERQDDGKVEVVVKPGWPHIAKTNRKDGSYATSDLMAAHPSVPNAWRYDSRADSQLTLITGKKFDPAPLEDSLASSSLLDDVLIFGNDQPFPGALLFRSLVSENYSDTDLVGAIAPMVEMLNTKSQRHAQVPINMLVPIRHDENKLQKSSKGTVLRNKALETYAATISTAYRRLSSPANDAVPDAEMPDAISKIVQAVAGSPGIEPSEDLFAHGVDSLGSIQIRHALRRLLPPERGELPVSIVEDCATISKLSDFILRSRHDEPLSLEAGIDDEVSLMHQLVDKHGRFDRSLTPSSPDDHNPDNVKHTILLTGATGALGAHILSQYRSKPTTQKIYCLVRGADVHSATQRVQKSLTSRELTPLYDSDEMVSVLPCKLSKSDLGLSQEQYQQLQQEVTIVIHAAWSVNFRWRLPSFEKDHIAGTRHLVDLALSSQRHTPPSFIFCSSIASVSSARPSTATTSLQPTTVYERPSTEPLDASPLGYSRSKWVTESILARAKQCYPSMDVQILRIGQLSGDSVHGIWNTSEAWPLMLGSMIATGCLPDLKGQSLDWLAVDVAAQGIIECAAASSSLGTDGNKENGKEASVRHILNPDRTATWKDLLAWLQKFGEEFEAIRPVDWIARLEQLEQDGGNQPALRLLGMWRERYGKDGASGEDGQGGVVKFDVSEAIASAPSLRSVRPVDEEYFLKMWQWVKENIH